MDDQNEIFTAEVLKRMEDLAVSLYNKIDYDSAEFVCSIIQDIYINMNKSDQAKRIENIIKKLHVIKNYMETNRDIFTRPANESKSSDNKKTEQQNESPEKENKE